MTWRASKGGCSLATRIALLALILSRGALGEPEDTEEVLTVEDVSDAAAGMDELEHVEAAHDGDRVDAEADGGDVPQGGGAEAQEGKERSDQISWRTLLSRLPDVATPAVQPEDWAKPVDVCADPPPVQHLQEYAA